MTVRATSALDHDPSGDGPSGRLAGRFIGLGICGSIAAYRAVEILRLLQVEGADVQVMMTPSSTRFVSPLTLAALSRHPVEADVLALMSDGRIGHIVVAEVADVIVVAPATAHWLAAMAAGLAGDAVTAACLSSNAPVVVAPAMDGEMYAHPATQANVARLRDGFGYRIVPPEWGPLASAKLGLGRLAPPETIVEAVVEAIGNRPIREPRAEARPPTLSSIRGPDLESRHVIVTAGGTAEPIDPVRFIGNRSSGRMGVAIAEAALERGARVTLIAAIVSIELPEGARVIRVESTEDMQKVLRDVVRRPDGGPGFDALIMAAAVADFRPRRPGVTKLSRDAPLILDLEPTPDLLAEVGREVRGLDEAGRTAGEGRWPRPILVGFAAETGSLERAAEKLHRKGLDLLVANDVTQPGSGFGSPTNRVTLYAEGSEPEPWPLLDKREVADRLLDRIVALLPEPGHRSEGRADDPRRSRAAASQEVGS